MNLRSNAVVVIHNFLCDWAHNQAIRERWPRGLCSSYTCVRMAVNKMTATLLVALLLAAGRFSQCYSGSDTTERGHETGIYILLYSMRLCDLHCP